MLDESFDKERDISNGRVRGPTLSILRLSQSPDANVLANLAKSLNKESFK